MRFIEFYTFTIFFDFGPYRKKRERSVINRLILELTLNGLDYHFSHFRHFLLNFFQNSFYWTSFFYLISQFLFFSLGSTVLFAPSRWITSLSSACLWSHRSSISNSDEMMRLDMATNQHNTAVLWCDDDGMEETRRRQFGQFNDDF